MESIRSLRNIANISQRKLADLAGVSFRTVQLLESRTHDARLSTLEKVSRALGYGRNEITDAIEHFYDSPPDSVRSVSRRLLSTRKNWKLILFDFVDAFRRNPDKNLVQLPPISSCELRLQALLAAVVEALCEEVAMTRPLWVNQIASLEDPWFVAGVENLKASALVESPISFRKRNIFVLDNFLDRA